MLQVETEGLHPTTELCLTALQELQAQREFHNILDMGCGGGILTVLCAHLWDARVLGADVAEKAVAETRAALAANGLEDRARAVRSDGFLNEEIRAAAPYDLIIINLLAEPITQWAHEVRKCLSPDGVLFLGGILEWHAAGVIEAYKALGFEIQQKFLSQPWHGFLLCHK